MGFTGPSFSAQASLHHMLSPGCILAWVNPVWDALIFLCQTTPSPNALKGREAFQAIDATLFSRKILHRIARLASVSWSQVIKSGHARDGFSYQERLLAPNFPITRSVPGPRLILNYKGIRQVSG